MRNMWQITAASIVILLTIACSNQSTKDIDSVCRKNSQVITNYYQPLKSGAITTQQIEQSLPKPIHVLWSYFFHELKINKNITQETIEEKIYTRCINNNKPSRQKTKEEEYCDEIAQSMRSHSPNWLETSRNCVRQMNATRKYLSQ